MTSKLLLSITAAALVLGLAACSGPADAPMTPDAMKTDSMSSDAMKTGSMSSDAMKPADSMAADPMKPMDH